MQVKKKKTYQLSTTGVFFSCAKKAQVTVSSVSHSMILLQVLGFCWEFSSFGDFRNQQNDPNNHKTPWPFSLLKIHPWKLTWLAGKSPCSKGNTSSFMVVFPLSFVSFGGVYHKGGNVEFRHLKVCKTQSTHRCEIKQHLAVAMECNEGSENWGMWYLSLSTSAKSFP